MFRIMRHAGSLRFGSIAMYFSLLGGLSAFETVVIDAGHGGNDEGTQWYQVPEKTITLAVAQHLECVLQDKGIPTVMTRTYDHYVSLDERAEKGNRIPNSLFVSIHFNATRDQRVQGFQSFYDGDSAKFVARSIQDAMAEKLPGPSLGIKRQDFAVITRTNQLAVLLECGFVSNKAEAMRLRSNDYQHQLAEAIALGILRIKPLINTDPVKDLVALRAEHEQKKAETAARKLASIKKKPGKKR
jgi:N-acetylmuramoyl-L-alanine amidase